MYFTDLQKNLTKQHVNGLLPIYDGLKFNVVAECTYVKPLSDEYQGVAFKTNNFSVLLSTPVETTVQRLIQSVCSDESKYEGQDSGWTLHSVDGISRYKPLMQSSFLALPVNIAKKHIKINPHNKSDNICFK